LNPSPSLNRAAIGSPVSPLQQAYTRKSDYCDFDHPEVAGPAKDLANGEPNPVLQKPEGTRALAPGDSTT
jgi:hypothetical protein